MSQEKSKGSRTVLYISSVIVLLFVAFGMLLPNQMNAVVDAVFAFLTTGFGWLYLLTVFLFVLLNFGIAFSRFGRIRLGRDDEKPEFSNFQWFAMLFGGGIGIGLVFWSIAEPITHYLSPPMGEAGTPEAKALAMRLVFQHFGIHPWVVFAICGLALAYFQFRKGLPFMISSAFYPLIGDRIYGPIGKAIDIFAVFATVFGVATSLGLGASQIATGLEYLWGVPSSPVVISIVIAVITVIFTLATISGLHKAMQAIANFKVWLSIASMVFLFVFGGAVYVLNNFTGTLGNYLQNFIGQSLWMENPQWLSGWTVFHWAWWIAWAPFVGQFMARVSRGRTIREFCLGVGLLPSGFSLVWLGIYGGAAFNLDEKTGGLIQAAVESEYTTALFATLEQLPAYIITGPLAVLLVVVSFIGAANSATFVLAMFTGGGNMNPGEKLRGFWGLAQGAITIMLILAGGTAALKALQTVSIAAAFPFMFVMIAMCISMVKAFRSDPAAQMPPPKPTPKPAAAVEQGSDA